MSWVVNSGSSHRGQASIDRLQGDWPTLRLVHLPVQASWLNQVKVDLSVCQRKVLTPNDVADLGEVNYRLLAFQRRDGQAAVPLPGASPRPTLVGCWVAWRARSGR